ncbi:MAG: GNAT family N-acetyltransferase [Nannocystales bacterium]
MPVQVREAQLEDTPDICRMLLQLGHDGDEALVRRRLERVLGTTDHVVLLAQERPHGSVGILHASTAISLQSPPRVDVHVLVVTSAHREAGAGRALLERLHNWALRRGIDDVATAFARHRKTGHAFFGKLGYSVAGERRLYKRDLASPLRTHEDSTAMD